MNQPAVIRGVAEVAGNFAEAAPGHRFNLYFSIWREHWSADNTGKKSAIKDCTGIPPSVAAVLKGLRVRQQALFDAYPEGLHVSAVSTAPFATGLGNEHPVENGFAFLTPYGLPYLAGSGVKGILRRAAEELALFPEDYARQGTPGLTLLDVWWLFGFEGAAGAWWILTRKEEERLSEEAKARRAALRNRFLEHCATLADRPDLLAFICRVVPPGGNRVHYLDNPRLFLDELDSRRGEIHSRGALSFWDVFPAPPHGTLSVEIMTPHYGDYYQRKLSPLYPDGMTPHDAGQPNPIPFLAVPPESAFDFHVICAAQDLPEGLRGTWKSLAMSIFDHAFHWLGFGAKTAVGYGVMKRDLERQAAGHREREERLRKAREAAEAQRLAQEKEASLAAMDPVDRAIQEFLDSRPNKRDPEISAVIGAIKQGRWQGEEKVAVARWLKARMQATKGMWKESSQAKRPEKDHEYQNTLLIKKWLES